MMVNCEDSKFKALSVIVIFINRSAPVGLKEQSKWIYEASSQKFLGIEEGMHSHGVLTTAVAKTISGLGWLTSNLQSSQSGNRSIRTAEKGIFLIDYNLMASSNDSDEEKAHNYLRRVLRRAVLDGLIRLETVTPTKKNVNSDETATLGYRLHKRYSSYFVFSYRGAYEPVKIDAADLYQLYSRSADVDPKTWAKRISDRIIDVEFNQLELGFNEGTV